MGKALDQRTAMLFDAFSSMPSSNADVGDAGVLQLISVETWVLLCRDLPAATTLKRPSLTEKGSLSSRESHPAAIVSLVLVTLPTPNGDDVGLMARQVAMTICSFDSGRSMVSSSTSFEHVPILDDDKR